MIIYQPFTEEELQAVEFSSDSAPRMVAEIRRLIRDRNDLAIMVQRLMHALKVAEQRKSALYKKAGGLLTRLDLHGSPLQ